MGKVEKGRGQGRAEQEQRKGKEVLYIISDGLGGFFI